MRNVAEGMQTQSSPESEPEFVPPKTSDMGAMLDEISRNAPVSSGTSKNKEVEKSMSQQRKQLDDITENNQEIDRFYQEQMDKKWTVLDKLGNSTMYQEVQKVKFELLKTSSRYRLGFYKTLLDARLEALNEKCDAGLKMIKGHYRQEVSSFLMAKMEKIAMDVNERQVNFINMMKGKYVNADALTDHPSLQKKFLESIFEEESRYLKFLDSLLARFESIVDEQLEKY